MASVHSVVTFFYVMIGCASGSTFPLLRTRGSNPSYEERIPCLRFRGGARVEHTFAMLKPDVASKKDVVDEVTTMIKDAGLTIERRERCKLSKELCKEFYAEHRRGSSTTQHSCLCMHGILIQFAACELMRVCNCKMQRSTILPGSRRVHEQASPSQPALPQ